MAEKKMEMQDLLDKNGNPTGRRVPRGTLPGPGEYVGTAAVALIDHSGRMLIQKRADSKKSWPGIWDISALGAVTAGETPQEAAMRELKEEMGLDAALEESCPDLTVALGQSITFTFVEASEIDMKKVLLQPSEVAAARTAGKEEILKMIREGSFYPYKESFIGLLFETAEEKHRI